MSEQPEKIAYVLWYPILSTISPDTKLPTPHPVGAVKRNLSLSNPNRPRQLNLQSANCVYNDPLFIVLRMNFQGKFVRKRWTD